MLYNSFTAPRKDLHFGIEGPSNLRPKHLEALVKYWIEKGLGAATIENNLSIFRLFSSWINKNGMVKSLAHYAPHMKRQYAAKSDKSWSAKFESPWKIWERVLRKDENVAMQLLLGFAFGARRKEMVRFKPLLHANSIYIELCDGTKGGRRRVVPVESEFQQHVVRLVTEHVQKRKGRPDQFIGNPNKDLKQNLARFDYVMQA
ncbi:hypothetical protein BH11PSE11_BH11PSE11_06750 [soil metagenome]